MARSSTDQPLTHLSGYVISPYPSTHSERVGVLKLRVGRVVLAFVVSGNAFAVADGQSVAPRRGGNPEAATIKNPVEATPASVTAGRRVYQRLCIRCHGADGKGDAASGGAQPPDLTDARWDYGGSDGDIFAAVHDGTSPDMEGYAARMSDTDIWNVVNYLRTIGPQ